MKKRRIALLVAVVAVGAAASADAREKFHHRWLVNSVTAERIHRHLERLQAIASRNDDTRALGTPGYKASVRYVVDRLRRAHYHPVVQEFTANLFEEHTPPILEQLTPNAVTYTPDTDFTTMQYLRRGRYPLGATRRDQRHRDPADADPFLLERLRGERFPRQHNRQYRAHPARHLHLRAEGPERRRSRCGGRGDLQRRQPGPHRPVERHAHQRAADPRRRHDLRLGRRALHRLYRLAR